MSALIQAFQTAITEGVDKVPKDFLTTEQWAANCGKSRPQTGLYIRRLIAVNKVEVRQFRIRTGQRVCPVPHYRLK